MKKKPPRLAPRNPLVAQAHFKKAGAHEKPHKAQRRAAQMALKRHEPDFSSGGCPEFLPKCRPTTTFWPEFRSPQPNKENDMQQEIIRRFLETSRAHFELDANENNDEALHFLPLRHLGRCASHAMA